MADISDVEQAFANLATSTLYPGGTSETSAVGVLCRIYRGWPNPAGLNTDLAAGNVNITIAADNEPGQTTTRYLPQWMTKKAPAGVAISSAGTVITVSGTPAVGDTVGVLIDGVPYVYRVQANDTPALIAANIGLAIQNNRAASYSGTTITVPGAYSIVTRVASDGSATSEVRRQEKDIRLSCWCPTPAIRDSVASALDVAFAQLSFMTLSDESRARVSYKNTVSFDQSQNALLYRRDLIYAAEYPTIVTLPLPALLFGALDINGNTIYA